MRISCFFWKFCVLVFTTRLTGNHAESPNEKCGEKGKEFTINTGDLQDPMKLHEISEFFRVNFENFGEKELQISTTISTERGVHGTTTLRSSAFPTSAETSDVVETTSSDEAFLTTRFSSSTAAPWTTSTIETTPSYEVPSTTTSRTSIAVTSIETSNDSTEADYTTASTIAHDVSSTASAPWTTRTIETTQNYGRQKCEDDEIYYGGYCFWSDTTERSFTASESKCKSKNSDVGYILNSDHYKYLMEMLRDNNSHGYFWLGLRQNLSTGAVTIILTGQEVPFLK